MGFRIFLHFKLVSLHHDVKKASLVQVQRSFITILPIITIVRNFQPLESLTLKISFSVLPSKILNLINLNLYGQGIYRRLRNDGSSRSFMHWIIFQRPKIPHSNLKERAKLKYYYFSSLFGLTQIVAYPIAILLLLMGWFRSQTDYFEFNINSNWSSIEFNSIWIQSH